MGKTRCIIIEGKVIIDGFLCGSIGYDPRQEKFLFLHESNIYEKGFKMYYGYCTKVLQDNINKKLK